MADGAEVRSPYDTGISSGSRFAIEVVAWVAGPWAVAEITGSAWVIIPTLVVLMGLPSLFNTPGDKNFNGIATPGPLRILIEIVLLGAAFVGAWVVWPVWAAVAVSILGGVMVVSGLPRYRWLATRGRAAA